MVTICIVYNSVLKNLKNVFLLSDIYEEGLGGAAIKNKNLAASLIKDLSDLLSLCMTQYCIMWVLSDVDEEGDEEEEDWEEGAEDLMDTKSTFEGPTAKEIESNRRLEHLFT